MPSLRSAFVGLRIQPDQTLQKSLQKVLMVLNRFERGISIVPSYNYHITLAFMGAMDKRHAIHIFEQCGKPQIPPFEIQFQSMGAFSGGRLQIRVLFAKPKMCSELELLGDHYRSLADRDPVFHLTLARIKSRHVSLKLKDLAHMPLAGQAWISSISLMANVGTGRYVDLQTIQL